MSAPRNIAAEAQAAKDFAMKYGHAPETSQDLALLSKMTYATVNDLPDELKNANTLSLYQSGAPISAPQTAPSQSGQTLDQQQQGYVNQLQANVAGADVAQQAAAQNFQQTNPSVLGGAFQGLQQAIRTKVGTANESIGPSDLFQGAGLTGFETLHQALQQKQADLADHSARLDNTLSIIGDQFKTAYLTAKTGWDIAHTQYSDAVNRADTAMNNLLGAERQIQLIGIQSEAAQKLAEIQAQNSQALADKQAKNARDLAAFNYALQLNGGDVAAANAAVSGGPGGAPATPPATGPVYKSVAGEAFNPVAARNVARLPAGLQKFADAGPNGVAYINADKVPADLKNAVQAQAAASGLQFITGADVAALRSLDTTFEAINQLEKMSNELLDPGIVGRLEGVTRNKADKLIQTARGVELNQFDNYRLAAVNAIKAIASGGSGLRITDAEIQSAVNSLPTSEDNKENALKNITTFRKLLTDKLASVFPDAAFGTKDQPFVIPSSTDADAVPVGAYFKTLDGKVYQQSPDGEAPKRIS